jgi:hypothetical protein
MPDWRKTAVKGEEYTTNELLSLPSNVGPAKRAHVIVVYNNDIGTLGGQQLTAEVMSVREGPEEGQVSIIADLDTRERTAENRYVSNTATQTGIIAGPGGNATIYKAVAKGGRRHRRITRKKRKSTRKTRKHL